MQESPHRESPDDPSDRRRWLSVLLAGGGAIGSAIIGLPALVAAISPALQGRRGPVWRRAGAVDDFPLRQIQGVEVPVQRRDWSRTLQTKTVYVWRRGQDDFIVYSRNCTDLSCPLTFDPGSECFFCPCHGAIFGKDGRPMAGPPAKPLFRYATRIRNGVLEVDLYSLPPMT